jgi:hypothetical protein
MKINAGRQLYTRNPAGPHQSWGGDCQPGLVTEHGDREQAADAGQRGTCGEAGHSIHAIQRVRDADAGHVNTS